MIRHIVKIIFFGIFLTWKSYGQSKNWIVAHDQWDANKYFFLRGNTLDTIIVENTSDRLRIICYWMHKQQQFIGYETVQASNKWLGTISSNIVLIDTNGKAIEVLYESKRHHLVSDPIPSSNDKYLVFYSWVSDTTNSGFMEEVLTIRIMELESKRVIRSLPTSYTFWNFEMQDNPWSPTENEFIYTVSNDINVSKLGQPQVSKLRKDDGIYLYNIEKDIHIRILDKGRYAIWSADGKHIAYMIGEKKACVFDLSTGKSRKIFRVKGHARISKMFWVPQTNNLYLGTIRNRFNSRWLVSHNAIIKDVLTGKKQPLPNIKLDLFFTWK